MPYPFQAANLLMMEWASLTFLDVASLLIRDTPTSMLSPYKNGTKIWVFGWAWAANTFGQAYMSARIHFTDHLFLAGCKWALIWKTHWVCKEATHKPHIRRYPSMVCSFCLCIHGNMERHLIITKKTGCSFQPSFKLNKTGFLYVPIHPNPKIPGFPHSSNLAGVSPLRCGSARGGTFGWGIWTTTARCHFAST